MSQEFNCRVGASIPVGEWHRLSKASTTPAKDEAAEAARLKQRISDAIEANKQRKAPLSHMPTTALHALPDFHGGLRKGENIGGLSFEVLRIIRQKSPLIKPIHLARQSQIQRMCTPYSGKPGSVGWQVVHKDHNKPDRIVPKSIRPYISQVEQVLQCPAPGHNVRSFSDLLKPLVEDLLTINRPVVEKLYSATDPNLVVGLKPVDGGIVYHTRDYLRHWLRNNPAWGDKNKGVTVERLRELLGQEFKQDIAATEFVIVQDNVIVSSFEPGRLLVVPEVNHTDVRYNGYYPSRLEEAAEIALTFINTWEYNSSLFTRGMMSEFILGISGNIADSDIDNFMDMFREASRGVRRAHSPVVMPLPEGGKIERIDLKKLDNDMLYEVFQSLQASLCTAIYRMHPSTINMRPWDGGSSPSLQAPSEEKQISLAQEEGLHSICKHFADSFLTPLCQSVHPDLIFIWHFGEDSPQEEIQLLETKTRFLITRNEARINAGLHPIGFYKPAEDLEQLSPEDADKWRSNPWNMPADPSMASMIQQQNQPQQLPGGEPGQPGQPGPEDTEDGFGGKQGDTEPDGYGGGRGGFPYGKRPDPDQSEDAENQPDPLRKGSRRTTTFTISEDTL